MALLEVQGHACTLVNGSKGGRHDRKSFAQGSRSQGHIVSVCTGASSQKPRLVRFRRDGRGQQPSKERIEGHGKQIAARRAALSYAPHHREMPSNCAGMLDVCVMEPA